jgi:uncharacterized ParB-like nuclease family protein
VRREGAWVRSLPPCNNNVQYVTQGKANAKCERKQARAKQGKHTPVRCRSCMTSPAASLRLDHLEPKRCGAA